MQSTDRDEFNAQMRKLCGGYDVFPSPDRIEAYWIGLQKLSIAQMGRCVERALSEDGPEKFPNVHGVWELWREMRRAGPEVAHDAAPTPDGPALQSVLCAYVTRTLRLTPKELARPWAYIFREWWVDKQRISTLTGVDIVRDNSTITRITVAEMFADTEGHAKAVMCFAHGGSAVLADAHHRQ